MKSIELKNVVYTPNRIVTIGKVLETSSAAKITCYLKPKVRSYIVGAKFQILKSGNFNESSPKIVISKTNIVDSSIVPDTIQISTNVTAADVATSSLWDYTIPDNALTDTSFVTHANITSALIECDPTTGATTTAGNAIKIELPQLSAAVTGLLTIELMPA